MFTLKVICPQKQHTQTFLIENIDITVSDLKTKLQVEYKDNPLPQDQRLVNSGKLLQDNLVVSTLYHIGGERQTNNATIHLVVKELVVNSNSILPALQTNHTTQVINQTPVIDQTPTVHPQSIVFINGTPYLMRSQNPNQINPQQLTQQQFNQFTPQPLNQPLNQIAQPIINNPQPQPQQQPNQLNQLNAVNRVPNEEFANPEQNESPIMILLRLSFIVYIITQGADPIRIFWVILLASIAFLYQIGSLNQLIEQFKQRITFRGFVIQNETLGIITNFVTSLFVQPPVE